MQDVQNNKNKYEARKKGIVLDNRNDKNISYERYKKESLNK